MTEDARRSGDRRGVARGNPPGRRDRVSSEEGADTLARGYLGRKRALLPALRAALAATDLERLEREGHRLKGTGASFGHPGLTALGAALERAARKKDLPAAARALAELAGALEEPFAAPNEAAHATTDRPLRLLLVDDDEDMAHLIAAYLRPVAATLTVRVSGEGGLEVARAGPPDVVVLDLGLPDRDGFEVLEALKAVPETAEVPVLVLSGQRASDVRERAHAAGAAAVAQKPLHRAAFLDLLTELRGAAPPTSARG